MNCWNCKSETHGAPFCPSCGKIAARPPDATLFDVFGLPRTTRIDTAALEKQFRELSLKLHPDRFAQADPRERRLSLEQTTALNEAYKTLKDPVRRAFYLLKLHGIDLDREDAGAQKNMPLEFLEEVMELREALEGARKAGDVARAQKLGEQVGVQRKAALGQAEEALQALESQPQGSEQTPQALEALRTAEVALGRVRYFTRFLEEVEAIEEEALG